MPAFNGCGRDTYKGAKLSVLQEGAWADILMIDGDPTQDIDGLEEDERNVGGMSKGGKIFKNTPSLARGAGSTRQDKARRPRQRAAAARPAGSRDAARFCSWSGMIASGACSNDTRTQLQLHCPRDRREMFTPTVRTAQVRASAARQSGRVSAPSFRLASPLLIVSSVKSSNHTA
jgi:hypothetical protein